MNHSGLEFEKLRILMESVHISKSLQKNPSLLI